MDQSNEKNYEKNETDTVIENILAARGVADFVRTSLGPKGMDKMIANATKDVIISNDGATILENLKVMHPVARMLVELSKSQDIEAGDGTTSVVVIAGALLEQCKILIEKGLHPNTISENFKNCAKLAPDIITKMAEKVSIDDDKTLINAAITSLSSKFVSQDSSLLAPIAVKAIKTIASQNEFKNDVDLNNIKIVTKLGGTVGDSELVNGLVFDQKVSHQAGGPTVITNAKIALIQFQLSPPKTDMDFGITISQSSDIQSLHHDERRYAANLVTKIAKTGCNVLLIQKSIIRDAVNPLVLHFLARKGIMVVKDIQRENIEFISRSLGCRPIAAIEEATPEKLGFAERAEETKTPAGSLIFVRGVRHLKGAVSILIRGGSEMVLREAERSLHDALCVVRCLVRSPLVIPGGAAVEAELAHRLRSQAGALHGAEQMCFEAFAEALETVIGTLAENCGLSPVKIVSELRDEHLRGVDGAGIDVRRGKVADMRASSSAVVQPALVSLKAVALATECVQMVLKIDGIVQTVREY